MRLITYADQNMDKSAYKLIEDNQGYFTSTYVFEPEDIPSYFWHFNSNVLIKERGAGYWLWKPFFILIELSRMEDNEILMYSDAGVEFVNNPQHIVDAMDQDIFLFGNNYKHVEWCKMDVLEAIIPSHEYLPGDTWERSSVAVTMKQAQASVIFIRNNETTRNFVKEWLLWCQMPGFIDDSPSKLPNYPTFAEHRHDQAILTCLAYKHGYKLHYWPAQYNNGAFKYDKLPCYSNDNYPIIFYHHRKRNNEW